MFRYSILLRPAFTVSRANGKSDLSLKFKTSRRSGLLLLAAGMEDYLILELLNGKLQARMKVGAGEVMLSSSQDVPLNNLRDHQVFLTLQDGKLTMMIVHLFSTYVPVDLGGERLNIDRGIWIGGTGDLDTPYLRKAIPPFRGCITDVKFESHQFNILNSAFKQCQDTKESCSSEFEHRDGETISFSTPDSFVSFSTWSESANAPMSLEFLMKTTIEDALLVFHHGQKSDFIAIGVVKGYLNGVLDLGDGLKSLENTQVQLDDDQWHRVQIQVSLDSFVLKVDSQSSSITLDSSQKLDLVGNLYFGGIQKKMKEVFSESGSLNRFEDYITSESFIGCFGEIKVNQRDKGLQDALVTKDVHIKCEGDDYDYSTYEEFDGPTTSSPIVDFVTQFAEPQLNEQECYPNNFEPEVFRNVTKLLNITTLRVPDGEEAYLDINNLRPTFDLSAAGLSQSQIIFTLTSDPWYGLVDVNVNRNTEKFSLLDVVDKKIKYMHDGNGGTSDKISLYVRVLSNSYLPGCLKGTHSYSIPVEIIPGRASPGSTVELPITEKGRSHLSPNLLKISQSASNCDQLVITVTSAPSFDFGYLVNSQQPGRKISEFTCRDLKDGNIYFVHNAGSTSEMTLKMSEGGSVTQSSTFMLLAIQPNAVIVGTTGLSVVQGSNASIGIQNLAVSHHPRNGDILYNVTQPPVLGELRVRGRDGMYTQVTSFHQFHLDRELIRYFSTDTDSHEDIAVDNILFDIHLGEFVLTNNLFRVEIQPPKVKVSYLEPLEAKPGEKQIITKLRAEVQGKTPNPQTIKYILVKSPAHGSLQISDKELNEGDMFTQKDILDNALSYIVRMQGFVDTNDQFQFRVSVEDQYSPLYSFPISILAGTDDYVLTNKHLVVLQGGELALNKNHLWLQFSVSQDILYRVTQEPKHGRLIRDTPGLPRFDGAVKYFSNEDLVHGQLIYKHDGSRTTSDEFHFSATQQDTDSPKVVMGIFKIQIQFKNEHVPVRIVDKVFNVVRRGQRLLTTNVIQFKDEDSNFNDTQIVYAREGILSGNIMSASNPSQPVFRFTQADLRDKNILFVHHGADQERFPLQVSDGFHKTTAMLQIQAGEPYLQLVNNTMIVIDHGSTKTLNTSLLSADSNMDIRDESEIKFEVTSPPSDGRIIVSGIEASQFTQEDLKKGVVSYEHNYESLKAKDSFGFTVRAKELSEKGIFKIKIFKQGYLSEPEVITNEVIISYEGEHTIISQDHLKVKQTDILPTDMIFTLKKLPNLGHVVMLKNSSEVAGSPVLDYIHSFSQEDINLSRVFYVNKSEQTPSPMGSDSFTLDVSNGFSTVEDLTVKVDIMPRFIPIQASNFSIKEGLSRVINEEILNISNHFYSLVNIDFSVEELPQHGEIRNLEGDELSYFTWDDVKFGQVFYMHDSSETMEDSFTLSASSYEIERRSLPVTISVTIIPVNDEPPMVTRNTGLEQVAITANVLSTEDADTPVEELVYHVEMPTNGVMTLKQEPGQSIQNFSQAQLNRGEIIFTHEGEESGEFSFTVTDGEHTSPLYRFVIKARPHTITLETGEELMVFPGMDSRRLPDFQRRGDEFYYEHQLPTEPFWVVRDSMEFTVSPQTSADVRHALPITVSYYAAHSNISSQMWKNKGLEIVQGQRKAIDNSIFDASNLLASLPEEKKMDADILFEIKRFPDHGHITLRGEDLPRDNPHFTQSDVSQGKLEYLHDDSGAAFDSLAFKAYLKLGSGGRASPAESVILDEIFHISVKRRGSNPPELVTTDMLLEVLQGSKISLTQKHLNTQDEDNPPDEVLFKVTKAPRNGYLLNSVTSEPLSKFTQEMINRVEVAFQSDGTLKGGFVEFTISDGEHETEPHTLHIGILAHTLLLKQVPEIKVRQGDDQILVTEEMLRASTGGPVEEDILYKITNTPKYAAVMVDRQPTSAFTQKQIKEGRVSVRFVKSTSPRDSVSFTARSRAANVSSVLNITVQPLAKIAQNPLLPQGSLVQLDRKLLDASPLANKTRASPTFTVIQQPRGARIVEFKDPDAGQPIQTFTQKDLDEGRVAMEILDTASRSKAKGNQDEARFLLKAHGVPPAECVLSFQTSPYNTSAVYPATLLKNPDKKFRSPGDSVTPSSPDSGTHGKPHVSRRGNFWSIFIPILVVLLLLLLAGVLAYYLIRKNKTGKHNVQTATSKPKNGEVATTETFRKTDPANNIPMSNVDSKGADPELLQHCRTTSPALKKNQYWV
uniref:Chondroitin sulfate proteoglycan 4 n=1 Tax=Xiphophorus couchianus TaxID=32473 RepID=A0A3B5N046_9TELE